MPTRSFTRARSTSCSIIVLASWNTARCASKTRVREGDFQGTAIVNYTEREVPYTRITEHKHFESTGSRQTVITREYPTEYQRGGTPYYPIGDAANTALFERYRAEAQRAGILVGGRLGTYRYYDMHQVVAQALAMAGRELGLRPAPLDTPVELPAAA